MNYKKETIFGMIWVFVDYFVVKGLSFFGSLFLARILVPSDFGIIAMISIFITLGNIFLDGGLSSSLIRNDNNDSVDYSTVFYINVLTGAAIYILFYSFAPLVAQFYNQAILTRVIRLYSTVFIFASFSSVQTTILIKGMKFKRIAMLNIPSVVLSLATGAVMAINECGVWSIVCMHIVNQIVLSISLWWTSDWKPEFAFSQKKFLYHFKFGYKLLLANVLNGTTTSLYNSIMGKFFSLNLTGNFERAMTLNNYPLMVLTQIIGKVSFPMLAGIQNENERLVRAYLKFIQVAFYINAPLMLLLSLCSKPLILILLGTGWMDAIPIFEILCFGGVFYTIRALNVNVIKIFGRTDYILKGEMFLKIVMLITTVISLFIGFPFFLWSIVLNSIFTLLLNMHFSGRLTGVSMMGQLKIILPTMVISLITFFVVRFFLHEFNRLQGMNLGLELLLATSSWIFCYLGLSYLVKIEPFCDFMGFLKVRKFK